MAALARYPVAVFSVAQGKHNDEDQANAVGRKRDIGRQAGRNVEDEGDDLRVRFDFEARKRLADRKPGGRR